MSLHFARCSLLAWICLVSLPSHGFFDLVNIESGTALSQTVVTVRKQTQSRADVFVFSVVSERERRVAGYRASNDYAEALVDQVLPKDVIFVDTGNWHGEAVLLMFTASEAYIFDPWTGSKQTILHHSSIYHAVVHDHLPRIDLFRDINGDGLDDFLIPTFTGYLVATQLPNGEFTHPLALEAPPLLDLTYNNNPWYQAKELFLVDMTLDSRDDITFWVNGEFYIYPQLANGEFSGEVIKTTSNIPFDFDGFDGMSVRMSDEDQSDKLVTVLHGLKDLDGDGLTDLVTMSVKSDGVFDKKTTIRYYRGRPGVALDDSGSNTISGVNGDDSAGYELVTFDAEETSSMQSKGIQYELEIRDINGDEQIDIVVSSIEIGIGRIIRALLTSSIKIDLGFYQMVDGVYPDKPQKVQQITAKFDMSTGEVWFPSVLLLDVNDDGIEDLLVQKGEHSLMVYQGQQGKKMFSGKEIEIEVSMPQDPEFVYKTMVNNDQTQDIVMKIPPPISNKEGPHRVILLISN
ncbi:MAG: hypothetical protein ABGY96_21420 [bacterium]|nr:hypothetical protein [Gammaproteobacteria bacterium]HIL94890.1 hypothetical protein [Pseudomonadales bacterium]